MASKNLAPRLDQLRQALCGRGRFRRRANRVQQLLHVLALRELHILHPREAQRQGKTVEPSAALVAKVAPVRLCLLARRRLEAHKRSLPVFASPRLHRGLHLCVTAIMATLAYLQKQPAGVMHALLPALPQPGLPRSNLPALRLALVRPRRFPLRFVRPQVTHRSTRLCHCSCNCDRPKNTRQTNP